MAATGQERAHDPRCAITAVWWLIFLAGLVVSLAMVFRSQVEGDTLNMLARGWYLAFEGEWLQFGMPTSAGGTSSGGFIALVVGLPLMAWADYRAPAVLVWLLGVVGYLVLDRIVGRVPLPSARLLFAVFYWLNPWRIHYTSFLWNPNFMFFLGALHLCAGYSMRRTPRFWASLVWTLIVGFGFQIHASAAVFGFISVLLWWRGVVRVNWWGVAVGLAVIAGSLVPWLMTMIEGPELIPGETGFPFRNLLFVYPLLKGLIYLLRYPSTALPNQVYDLDFWPTGIADDRMSAAVATVLVATGWITVLVSCASFRRFLRRSRAFLRNQDWSRSDSQWLRGYLFWSLAGVALAFAFSPTSVMFWQGFPVFHVAVLVTVLYMSGLARTRKRDLIRRIVTAYAVLMLAAACVIGVGSTLFRGPGPPVRQDRPSSYDVRHLHINDHPMYHDLAIVDRCGLMIVDQGGWEPDIWREQLVER